MFSDRLIFAAIDLWLLMRNFRMLRETEATFDMRFSIACPQTYVERMLWRRFIDRSPFFVRCLDKLETKAMIRARCPEALVPQTLWEGVSVDDIPPGLLRPGVWLKASHGSGFNHRIIGAPDEDREIRRKAASWLKKSYGRKYQEWGYHQVPRKIFLEENIAPESGKLWEFSVRVAGGRFVLGSIMCDSKTPAQVVYYLDGSGEPSSGPDDEPGAEPVRPPAGLDYRSAYREAIRQACLMVPELDYARVDSIWDGRRVYAGEITIYPAGGVRMICHPGVARLLRKSWDLRESYFMRRTDLGWVGRCYAAALRRALDRAADQPTSFSARSSRG